MNLNQLNTFYNSLNSHNRAWRGTVGFPLMVTIMSSENDYLAYPVKGVITIIEQGTDLSVIVAVFRRLKEDGSLGAPVEVKNPVFTYRDDRGAIDAPVPRMSRRVYNALVEAERYIASENSNPPYDAKVLLGRLRTLIKENAA